MKFTVLGSGGFIGSALVKYLKESGFSVLALDRNYIEHIGENWGHVIYAIGLTADFREKPFETVDAHVAVISKVLQSCTYESILYLSSTRVYSGARSTKESSKLNVSPLNSSDLYNISKLLGESLCLSNSNSKVRVARISNVVGFGDKSSNFIASLLREAASGHILLRSSPESTKDYITIEDVVHLLILIAERGKHRLYNVASGNQISHCKWLEKICSSKKCTVKIINNAPIQKFHPIDVERIKVEFSYQPSDPFKALKL